MAAKKKKRGPGQPTKFKPEYVQALRDFFSVDAGSLEEVESSRGDVQFIQKPTPLPMFEDFARSLDVTYETVYNWAHRTDDEGELVHPEFAEAYRDAKAHQKRILVHNGLLGGYQQAFSIFTAKNILGWRDKQDIAHSGPGGGPIQTINGKMSPQEAAEAYADTLNEE